MLRRQAWLVVLTAAVVVGVALGLTLTQEPVYESTVHLVVDPVNARTGSELESLLLRRDGLSTQREIVTSDKVAAQVRDDLELERSLDGLIDAIDVSVISDTQILRITAHDIDPQVAARLAEGFANAYLETRREDALARLTAAATELRELTADARQRLDDIDRRLRFIDPESGEADALREERSNLIVQLGQYAAQTATIEASDEFSRGGGEIIRPARVPTTPVEPKPVRTGVLAVVLGTMLGAGFAFLRDYFDDALRDDEQVGRAIGGRPVLGHLPKISVPKRQALPPLPALRDPSSPAAEAARTLRTNVRFLGVREPIRSLAVTSAGQGEGKTTVAANLAVATSLTDARVVVVDADLRRPMLHRLFGHANGAGLSEVLAGRASLDEALVDVGVPNLRLLPAGARPPNPSELLSSPQFRETLRELERAAELVVIDTPPVLPVADAVEVAHWTFGALLVVQAGTSSRRAVRHATERLAGSGASVLGAVVNGIEPGEGYHYRYEYGYGYGLDDASDAAQIEHGEAGGAERPPVSGNGHRPAGAGSLDADQAERPEPKL